MLPHRSWPTRWNELFADIDTDHGDFAIEFLRHGLLLWSSLPPAGNDSVNQARW
jgi:hypothetical protein